MRMIGEIGTLLHRDLLLGFHYVRYRLLLSMVYIFILVGLTIYQFHQIALLNNVSISDYTFTDLIYMLLKGTDFQILNNPQMGFPFFWLMIQIICPFIIGGFWREDLFNQASILFVRVHNRLSLWISKLLFCFIVVLSSYLLYLIMTILAASIFLSFSANWSPYGSSVIQPLLAQDITSTYFVVQVFTLPLLSSLLLVTIQGVLSVFIRPIYALFIILSALIVSVYSSSFLFPGSYSMILRHRLVDSYQGFDWQAAILYTLVIVSFVSVFGYILFKRMDIIQKEEE